jgi:Fe2+ or Zn2+ uptake regulation protein
MTGKALMAEGSITRLESVIAGIRGYIGEQLSELENELGSTRGAVTALGEQLVARQAAIDTLEASRALLLAKLGELDGAEAETKVFAQARESREEAGDAVAEQIVTAVGGDAVVGALPTGAATVKAATGTPKLTASQLGVLGFLQDTPGVHKVSEIALAVYGGDSDNAALQAIRRALAALTGAGAAVKSTQSGTAFYSATVETAVAEAPAPAGRTAAKKAPAKKAEAKKAETPKAETPKADAKKAEAPKAEAKESTATKSPKAAKTAKATQSPKAAQATDAPAKQAKKPATRTARKATAETPAPAAATTVAETAAEAVSETVADKPSTPARARKSGSSSTAVRTARKTAKKAAPSATPATADKSVRADRTKIVAALLAASTPQSAGEVSRTVMGSEWKSSDATNFRNVLKSMVAEGVVAEQLGDNNRARYTVAATS